MDNNTIKALKTLSTYTAGRFDVWALAGDSKKSCRQHVMSELLGAKTPIAKCGVTAIREEFQKRLGATGDCIAAREGDFIKKARALLAIGTSKSELSHPGKDIGLVMAGKPHPFGPDVALNAMVKKSEANCRAAVKVVDEIEKELSPKAGAPSGRRRTNLVDALKDVDLTPRIIELLEEQKNLLRQLKERRWN